MVQQVTVRLYDGEEKVPSFHGFLIIDHLLSAIVIKVCVCVCVCVCVQTTFDGGTLQLTTHRIIWDDEDQEVRPIVR